jgi:vesicle-fusing ATPase
MASIDQQSLENLQVNRDDFLNALEEVKPLFGAAEEELQTRLSRGIIPYSSSIEDILQEGQLYVVCCSPWFDPVH